MALSKVDPSKIFKTCSILDPAIDKEATGEGNMKKFEDNYNIKLLKFKQDDFPTIFHIANILSSDEAKIKQDHLKIEFPELENASQETLKTIKLKEIKPKVTQVNSQEMMIKYFNNGVMKYEENGTEFECNADNFSYSITQEIGSLIMIRSQLGDDLKNA